LITKPTRVTEKSQTIIDHILTNDTKHNIAPGVIRTGKFSDHYVIVCKINNILKCKKSDEPSSYYRDKLRFNSRGIFLRFITGIRYSFHTSTSPPLSINNFNKLFDKIVELVLQTITVHAPLKRHSRKQKTEGKPW